MERNRVTRPSRFTQYQSWAEKWASIFPATLVSSCVWYLILTAGLAPRFTGTTLLLFALLALSVIVRRVFPPQASHPWVEKTAQTDIVLVPLSAIGLAAWTLGSAANLVFPLTLLVMLWASSTLSRLSMIAAASFAVLLELAYFMGRGAWGSEFSTLLTHSTFIVGFSGGGAYLLRAEVRKVRKKALTAIRKAQTNLQSQAENLGITDHGSDTSKSLAGRLDTVYGVLEQVLSLTRLATNARSVVLMQRCEDKTQFALLRACSPETELLNSEPTSGRSGLLAALTRERSESQSPPVIRISPLEGRSAELPYYTSTPKRIKSMMGLPIYQRGDCVSVLLLDRAAGAPFEDTDVEHAQTAVALITRLLGAESALLTTESRSEIFVDVIDALTRIRQANGPRDILGALLESTLQLLPVTFGAVVLRGEGLDPTTILHATGAGSAGCAGQPLSPHSLSTAVFEDPGSQETSQLWHPVHGELLGPGLGPDLSDGAPIILLPLEARGERTGLLVLATRYSLDAEQMAALRLLTEQAALAAYRTERIDQLEAHATVDEITVIDNRASVLGKLEQAAGRCGRTNQQLATLLIGIDQFPELSKAYGSGVTATVLRQVAYALGTCKRLNDTVGRTELSEFLVVLEGAGETGARQVAARIRQRIAELRFPTLGDTISVTVSMGVAIAPRDGERPTDLILRSQQALHRAQSHGTDQIVGFRDPTNSANVAGLQHA